jgi:hypothetical protein
MVIEIFFDLVFGGGFWKAIERRSDIKNVRSRYVSARTLRRVEHHVGVLRVLVSHVRRDEAEA